MIGREPDGSGGPHFFVDDLDRPTLSDDDRHHAERALRLRPGEHMTVSDGRGAWRPVRFGDHPEIVGDVVHVAAPARELSVGFALVKGHKPELVIQKLCELGVDRIEPFVAEHSVVRWDAEKATRALARWRGIVRSAAMQSRRVRVPDVAPLVSFGELVATPAVLADLSGRHPAATDQRILVGPEGGWSSAERGSGLDMVCFGRHVLRAETAAIAVAAIAVALRDGVARSN